MLCYKSLGGAKYLDRTGTILVKGFHCQELLTIMAVHTQLNKFCLSDVFVERLPTHSKRASYQGLSLACFYSAS